MEAQSNRAQWREAAELRGAGVTLEPLHDGHAAGLRGVLAGDALSRLWFTNVPTSNGFGRYLEAALEARDAGLAQPFAVRDAQGSLVGSTRLYDMAPEVPRLSIGYTWYAPEAQRTGINTEAKLLLLGHAFDTLGCINVTFETSMANVRSRAAIERLGAHQDGILRNHKRHADGSVRNTAIFSILDTEWPQVRCNLQARLARHGQVHS